MSDNQHYNPKSCLDKFIHPSSTQNVLYRYEKGQGARRAVGTRHLASAEQFYVQKEKGGSLTNKLDEARKADEVELFASGRRTSGPYAKCIYDNSYLPNVADRTVLARAAALLWWGSPVQIHNMAMLNLVASQMVLYNQLESEDVKQFLVQKFGKDVDQEIQQARQMLLHGRLKVDVGEENWKQLGFEACQYEQLVISGLCRMGLTVCHAHPDCFFITSDNPMVLTSASQPDSPGFGLEDAEVWLPISYNKGLLWAWAKHGTTRNHFGHSQTKEINRRVIKWCYKEVYSPLQDCWVDSAVKEITFDPCHGHYGTLQRVIENHTVPLIAPNDDQRQIGQIVDLIAGLRTGNKCDVVKI